ncbi:MAG: flavodoxin [Promethearchaeota archaeon]|nr:MAG: flavodoxin [Candidatus Lokiarchaeota archaeon]
MIKLEQKILVIYYSLTGNTKLIAETIQNAIGADIQEIKPVKELDPESGTRFMWGGMQATMKKKPKLEAFDKDPSDYDLIFIGTPVWAWQASPPIRSLSKMYDFSDKKVALWCCCSGKGIKAMERIKKLYRKANVVGEKIFQDPLTVKTEEAKQIASEWAKEIVTN